jgi:thiamine-monophosphate kinase
MTDKEFNLIETVICPRVVNREDVTLGIGDDGAVLVNAPHERIVVVMDTLVAGVHFDDKTPAHAIGHKALAVNLSDLAAMGALPKWCTLALTLPEADQDWVEAFMNGFSELCQRYQLMLVGGDTTQGPLAITVTAIGTVSNDRYLKRSGAKIGDAIYVSGTLGDAGAALSYAQDLGNLRQRLHYPEARVELGLKLKDISQCAIDISDGLIADLSHILKQSQVGALIEIDKLPLSRALIECVGLAEARRFALNSGDDYELCFTVPSAQQEAIAALNQNHALTHIGWITAANEGLALKLEGKDYVLPVLRGYTHFNAK